MALAGKRISVGMLAGFVLAAYLLPFWIMGENGRYTVWDNLDSTLVWLKVAAQKKYIFSESSARLDELSFVRRASLPSEADVYFWLVYFFGPLTAYLLQKAIVVLIAFWGMLLVLNRHIHVDRGDGVPLINIGTALCFATLPFWPFGLSVAGIPLLTFVFLNLYSEKGSWTDYLLLFLFPFYSSLVGSGFFFLVIATCLWLLAAIVKKKLSRPVFFGLVFLSAVYLLVSYRLIVVLFNDPTYTSHRVEMRTAALTLSGAISALKVLLLGPGLGHARTLQGYVVLPTIIAAILLLFRQKRLFQWNYFQVFWCTLLLTAVLNVMLETGPFLSFSNRFYMNFRRFNWMHPCLWLMLFGAALHILSTSRTIVMNYAVLLLLVLQLGYNFSKHEFIINRDGPSYNAFFAERQFQRIAKYIGKPQSSYRVGSIGLHPSIALYNGFRCIDVYCVDFSLDYKHRFRKVIAPELEKNLWAKNYVDFFGSRLYLYHHATGFAELDRSSKTGKLYGKTLAVDYALSDLKAIGCDYLLSAYPLNFSDSVHAPVQRGIFKDRASAWDIYLYQLH